MIRIFSFDGFEDACQRAVISDLSSGDEWVIPLFVVSLQATVLTKALSVDHVPRNRSLLKLLAVSKNPLKESSLVNARTVTRRSTSSLLSFPFKSYFE